MARLKSTTAKDIIRELNLMDLSRVEYGLVKAKIGEFISDFRAKAFTLQKGQRLYRGVVYQEKPREVSYLGAPPAVLVRGFQRCNKPNSPMFYCSIDPEAVLFELNVKPGDTVYISKWSVTENDFFVNSVLCELEDVDSYPALDRVYTYFETVFAQPIHETFSYQYKITAAISELLTWRNTEGDAQNRQIGGLSFPSVAHPKKADNLVLHPDVALRCLSLDYVEELKIVACNASGIQVEHTDMSSEFDAGTIQWAGRSLGWSMGRGDRLIFTAESDGWIARDLEGNVVNPS